MSPGAAFLLALLAVAVTAGLIAREIRSSHSFGGSAIIVLGAAFIGTLVALTLLIYGLEGVK